VGPTLVKLATQGFTRVIIFNCFHDTQIVFRFHKEKGKNGGHLKNWNACQYTSEIPSRFYMQDEALGCVSFTEWRALGEFLV
jgi:hypothetical protein